MDRAAVILARLGWTDRLAKSEDGQDLIEYGLLVGLIAIVALVTITNAGQMIYDVFWSGIAAAL